MGFADETHQAMGQEVTLTLAREDVALLDRCLGLVGRGTTSDGAIRFLSQHARSRLLRAVDAAEGVRACALMAHQCQGEPCGDGSIPRPDDQTGGGNRFAAVA